jgi:hypothetical protein
MLIVLNCASAPLPARAAFWEDLPRRGDPLLQGFSVGFFGGVQSWQLGTLEDALVRRAEDLATQQFELAGDSFGWRPAFGAELSYHFADRWLVRTAFEWARFAAEDRDGDSLPQLGGGLPFVSIGYKTTVEARYFLTTLGIQRVHHLRTLALSWGPGVVIAPVRVRDRVDTWLETETSVATQEINASGVGLGLDLTMTLDYLMESASSIYVDAFVRIGSTRVEVDEAAWDNSFTPGKRDVEFTGGGMRLGVRFN